MGVFRFFICLFLLLLSSASFSNENEINAGFAEITEAFGGTTISNNGTLFTFPYGAETWGGFANTNAGIYPIAFQEGGSIRFDGYVPSGGSVDVRFRLEYNPYPDIDPAHLTEIVTVTGDIQTEYQINIPPLSGITFSSLILYLETKDVPVNISSVGLYPIVLDNDNDGLMDYQDPDDDNDGVSDTEDAFPLDPLETVDTDNDGIGNNSDSDDDDDGVEDSLDVFPLNKYYTKDIDQDGMPDAFEDKYGLNKYAYSDASSDVDEDGLTALEEFYLETSPINSDTDDDTLPDGWEHENSKNPLVANYSFSSSLGETSTCALDDSGVVCWGGNSFGETGVPPLSNPKQISSGYVHTCAIDNSGMVCWGDNSFGKINVPALENPNEISLGEVIPVLLMILAWFVGVAIHLVKALCPR